MSKNNNIKFTEILSIIWNGKWFIVLCSILGFSISFFYLKTQPKVYQVDLLLEVEGKGSGIGSLLNNFSSFLQQGEVGIDSQIEIIKSRSILNKTVEKFHLTNQLTQLIGIDNILYPVENIPYSQINFSLSVPNDYWQQTKKPDLILEVKDENEWILNSDGRSILAGRNGSIVSNNEGYRLLFKTTADLSNRKFRVLVSSKIKAIDNLRENLFISSIDNRLLQLKFNSQDPIFAADILNNIAETYVANNKRQGSLKFEQGVKFIESQLPNLQDKLEKAELELNSFQTQNKTVNLSTESETLIRTLAQIEGQLTALELKTDELASRYTPKHPSMQAVFRQREVLLSRRSEIERQLSHLPKSNQGFIRLKRDVEVNQSIYLQLLSRLQELNVAKASSIGGIRIIDLAEEDKTKIVKPKKKLIFFFSVTISCLLAMLYLILRIFIHSRILVINDVIDNTGLKVCATVPESKIQSRHEKFIRQKRLPIKNIENTILAVKNPNDISIEALYSLRSNLFFRINENNNMIVVSGSTEDVGKTFISTNLAVLFTQIGKKVVLVNCDLRKGYLDLQFSPSNNINLVKCISNFDMPIESCIQPTSIPNFYYVPCGDKPKNPSELLVRDKFKKILDFLRQKYDLVIIDTPPILSVYDALQISQLYSNTEILLVSRFNKTTVRELILTQKKINDTNNTEIIGVVINGVKKGYADYKYQYHSYNEN